MYSYEEKDTMIIALDHLKCLKAMHDAGFDVSGIQFVPDYYGAYDMPFFYEILYKFFPNKQLLAEGMNYYGHYEETIIYVPMEEYKDLYPDSQESLDIILRQLTPGDQTLFWQEYPIIENASLVADHHGECCGLAMQINNAGALFFYETEILLRFLHASKILLEGDREYARRRNPNPCQK